MSDVTVMRAEEAALTYTLHNMRPISVLRGSGAWTQRLPYPRLGSSVADVFRPPQREHAVQYVGGDGHLRRLASIRLRT